MSHESFATAIEFPRPTPSDRFDGDKAFSYLETICSLGPRPTTSPALAAQRKALQLFFRTLGAEVAEQSFAATQPSMGSRPFECANLVVHWHPRRSRRLLFAAHYDTRPHADEEPVLRRQREPFIGANDGASGVALLMELGKRIPRIAPLDEDRSDALGIDFVFFDAEEYIEDRRRDRYFLGSEHFVRELKVERPNIGYEAVIVVDMVADKDLALHPDERSAARAGALVASVWGVAQELGIRSFRPEVKFDLLDDHVSFLNAGIPAIDLIDFDYPYWHRVSDTPDKCSAASLAAVGRVLEEWTRRAMEKGAIP